MIREIRRGELTVARLSFGALVEKAGLVMRALRGIAAAEFRAKFCRGRNREDQLSGPPRTRLLQGWRDMEGCGGGKTRVLRELPLCTCAHLLHDRVDSELVSVSLAGEPEL